MDHNIIDKSGAWFSYGNDRLGQGRENAKKFLEDNQDIFNEVQKKVKEKLGMVKPLEEIPAKQEEKESKSD